MSWLSEFLKTAGIPKSILDDVQDGLGITAAWIPSLSPNREEVVPLRGPLRQPMVIDGYKAQLVAKIPTAAAIAESVKRQDAFKRVYRALSPDAQKGVDAALVTVIECALVKLRKELNL